MKKRRTGTSGAGSAGGEQGFWPSFADMMSAVALILFFLMLLAYIQNMITDNDLRATKEALVEAQAQLDITSREVEENRKELEVLFENLNTARKDLDDQQLRIDEQVQTIASQQADIENQKLTIETQQQSIAAQQRNIADQQSFIASTQAELAQVRSQMESMVGMRVSIVRQISDSIQQVMGTSTVSVTESGSLVLNESVLFDSGSYQLKAASRQVLEQLSRGFATFLADPENVKYVETIVIAGHADSSGDSDSNLSLSANRARAVLSYMLSCNNGALRPYAQYFSASGYGDTRPVADNSTYEGRAKNRRIEISITLRDDSVMDILEQYLALEVPAG